MAVKGSDFPEDVILLSANRTECEQNVDCGHEFIHLYFQRDKPVAGFNCFEKVRKQQNPYFEWQANEGSAELLLSYKILLPLIKSSMPHLRGYDEIREFKMQLSALYNLTPAVIYFIIESLKYEIQQYLYGVPIDKIELLSANAQRTRRINVKSLNDIENEDFNRLLYEWSEGWSE